jgi:lysophospholipase L1-like esterase
MRNYQPLKDLYVSDGVHLSEEGGRLISEELLKYFAKENK